VFRGPSIKPGKKKELERGRDKSTRNPKGKTWGGKRIHRYLENGEKFKKNELNPA